MENSNQTPEERIQALETSCAELSSSIHEAFARDSLHEFLLLNITAVQLSQCPKDVADKWKEGILTKLKMIRFSKKPVIPGMEQTEGKVWELLIKAGEKFIQKVSQEEANFRRLP